MDGRTWWRAAPLRGLAFLLLLWLIQTTVAARLPLAGLRPALIPLGVSLAGVWRGSSFGGLFGLAAGLVWWWQSPGDQGLILPGLCLLGLLVGGMADRLPPGFWRRILLAVGGLALWEGGRLGLHLLLGRGVAWGLAGSEWAYTLLWLPLLYPLSRMLREKNHPPG